MTEQARLFRLKEIMDADGTDVGTLAERLNLTTSELIDAFPVQALELEETINGRPDEDDETFQSWTAEDVGFIKTGSEKFPWSDEL